MCGLTGFVGPGDQRDLAAMMGALAHRGPDGEGLYVDTGRSLYLGHRRLAVVDVASGAQPMWNSARAVGIVFNGEIYNHRELRLELQALGYVFQTDHCDTEVLVHGYSAWGEALPERLNGMFAFCIYDVVRQKLFLARDRLGEKPLYFVQQGRLFAFASEVSALCRHAHFTPRLSLLGLQKFFAYGFFPAPHTLYEHCQKLPGGCSMTFDLGTRELRVTRYWRFLLEPDLAQLRRPINDVADELRSLVEGAVEQRLAADVPVGFFLSGGLDSSLIVAAAARRIPADRIETFTLGFCEPSFDESQRARDVAKALGVANTCRWLDFDTARAEIPRVLAHLDEPSGDSSILPTSLLAQFARKRVTVALSGDGADELFAGYDPFKALAPACLYRAGVPRPLHRLLRQAVQRLPQLDSNMSLDFKLRRTLAGLSQPQTLWNPVWLGPLDPDAQRDIFNSPATPEAVYSEALDLWSMGTSPALVDKTLEFYTNLYLQDGILNKVDRATMMHGLEARSPFLDNGVVDFARRLPHALKMQSGERKFLLRRAFANAAPKSVLNRPKKGFGMPTSKWLRTLPETPPLTPVTGIRMRGVETAWRLHRQRRADNRLFLWSWLSLQQTMDSTRLHRAERPSLEAPAPRLEVEAEPA